MRYDEQGRAEDRTVQRQPRRRQRRLLSGGFVTSLVAASVPQLAAPAHAAVLEPPPAPYEVVIFPQRDFVSVVWNAPNRALTFDLTRGGVNIGHAASDQDPPLPDIFTDPAGNLLEVNHPGGLCWDGSTPDILPGDRLSVVTSGTADGVAATTANITAQSARLVGTSVVVDGVALDPDGSAMDLGQVEQRIISPGNPFAVNGRRDIRATSDGSSLGLVTARAGVEGGWRATYGGLTAADRDRAVAGETRGMAWQATNAAGGRLGLTIYEAGLDGGPGMPECPAAAVNSVAASSPGAVNAANLPGGLVLSGASFNASSVTVTLNDTNPATPPQAASGTPSRATGAGAYTVGFSGAQLAALSDGVLSATSSFVTSTGTIAGSGRSILKDTAVPAPPTSDTTPGRYPVPQSVVLSLPAGEDPASVVHFTTDGSTPGAASPTAQPIPVTTSRRIRAVVVDRAGNVSNSVCPAGCFDYVIGAAGSTGSSLIIPLAPRILDAEPGKRGGRATAVADWRRPKDNLALVEGYRIRALKLRPGRSAKVVKAVVVSAKPTKKAVRLPAGSRYRFQVRAFNAAGHSQWSDRSNKVRAR